MDGENRLEITLWLESGIACRTDGWLEENNCKSHGELTGRTPRFYMGYLATEDTSEYPFRALTDTLRGTLADSESRLRILLLKLCVEVNMVGRTVAAHFHADPVDRRELWAFAVGEVLRINGKISFDDILDLQRQVYPDGWVTSVSCPPT